MKWITLELEILVNFYSSIQTPLVISYYIQNIDLNSYEQYGEAIWNNLEGGQQLGFSEFTLGSNSGISPVVLGENICEARKQI